MDLVVGETRLTSTPCSGLKLLHNRILGWSAHSPKCQNTTAHELEPTARGKLVSFKKSFLISPTRSDRSPESI